MERRFLLQRGKIILPALLALAAIGAAALHFSNLPLLNAASAQVESDVSAVEERDTLEIAGLQRQFEKVAARVAPGVVAISASINTVDSDDVLRAPEMNAEKLQAILERTTRTVGTGLVLDSGGYILTNEHVIGEAEQLWVTTDDHKVYPAIVVGSDPRSDLAVLKVPAGKLKAVEFADPSSVHRGDWTIAMGNPYGLAGAGEMCMSVGVVSATHRSLAKLSRDEHRLYTNLIQTTAQINPGNSGGPLFDMEGKVVGINTAVILPQKSTNGIGFAIPVGPQVQGMVRDLREGREIVYGYLGVSTIAPTARQREQAGVTEEIGACVETVEQVSPAEAAELKAGDIVTKLNGQPVSDSDELVRLVGAAPIDKPTPMELFRHGKRLAIDVTLRKRQLPSTSISRANQRFRWRGMLLGPVPANWEAGTSQKPAKGLIVIGIDSHSPFVKQGISQGAIITSVAGMPVASVPDLQQVINDSHGEKWDLELAGARSAVVSVGE
ncbi:MAG TPA: trypsin-like peptidase domain-containing protein [Tepidisphaeraceae bacterium]|jgi:serine protease Do